jgi:hypothetical protein
VSSDSVTPSASTDLATKKYVDDTTNGGAVSIDRVVVAGVAGESVAAGNLLYFDDTDNEWKKTDADTTTTIYNVKIGTAQGAGSDGGSISGGVLVEGLDPQNTGLTAGVKYYASNTAGAISSSAGTNSKVIGWSDNSGTLILDPNVEYIPTDGEKAAMAGNSGTLSSSNRYVTEDYIGSGVTVQTFTSSGTWNKPTGIVKAIIEVVGGGAAGGGVTQNVRNGAGGGAGGYALAVVAAGSLGSTETVTIGAAGGGGTGTGGNGGSTSFGSHAVAAGGSGGTGDTTGISTGGAGGSGTTGDILITGQDGTNGWDDNTDIHLGS